MKRRAASDSVAANRRADGSPAAGGRAPVRLVDCDVHPVPRSTGELRDHLPVAWRDAHEELLSSYPTSLYSPVVGDQPEVSGLRSDAFAPDGSPAGSNPDFTFAQLFDEAGVDIAILIPLPRPQIDPSYESALCSAYNRWLDETWLTEHNRHGRYRGSICVCASDPETAALEIEYWAGHPTFVQIRVNAYTNRPLGDPYHEPIFRAAARHGYPIAIHFSKGIGSTLLSPVGFSSYFFEHHSLYPMIYAAHLLSVIANGVFDRFPDLTVVLVEGGYAWVAPFIWRMENDWETLSSTRRVRRRPSDYLADNVRVTTQPIEEPDRSHLTRLAELSGADQTLMFASDYPHWDFDNPKMILGTFPPALRQSIAVDNARRLYGLPLTVETLITNDAGSV